MNIRDETAFLRVVGQLELQDLKVIMRGTEAASAQCPAHEDHDPSLSLRGIEGQVLLHCHAGCQIHDVIAALGLTMADLFDEARVGARYPYQDATGAITRTVYRTPTKKFRQEGQTRGPAQLYRLPRVLAAVAAKNTIFIVEGEKDVHALESLGAVATTSPMGAANWNKVDPSPLRGAHVVVIPDGDEPGATYLRDVLASLEGMAADVQVMRAKVGKDAADHIAAGYTLEDFIPEVLPVDLAPATPTPLSRVPAPPPFPTSLLPEPFAAMVAAVAASTQTDEAMAGVIALGCLAIAAGGRVQVSLAPDWREPCNLFVAVESPPGTRKSAVMRVMTAPLVDAERQLVDKVRAEIVELTTLKDVADRAADSARKAAATAKPAESAATQAEAISAAMVASEIVVPAVPRLLADDVTPEVLATLLAEQKGRMGVTSPEGGFFENLAGRYSKMPNLDVALKGHAGDRLRVDRRGRTEYVESPALTLVLAIQPSVIESIGKVGEFAGRGLLARFLYARARNNVGRRLVDTTPVATSVRDAYANRLRRLTVDLDAWTEPEVLRLSPEAYELHRAAHRAHEPQLLSGTGALGVSQAVIEWASKLMGAIGRLAALLHLAEHGADTAVRTPISASTMSAALALGDYFIANALSIFDTMGADPVMESARTVLRHLSGHDVQEFSARELFTALPRSRFPKMVFLQDALDLLIDHEWISQLPSPPQTGAGRPPSPRFRVHASAAAETAQCAESLAFSLAAVPGGDSADSAVSAADGEGQ